MVDLSKAKAGDTVVFRNGGKAEITDLAEIPKGCFRFKFDGYTDKAYAFFQDGKEYSCSLSMIDITEVIPAPVAFDWSTVKAGMAFKHINPSYTKGLLFYVGKALSGNPVVQLGNASEFVAFKPDVLTRAPEHDIKEGV